MRIEMNQTREVSFEEIEMYMNRGRTLRARAMADMFAAMFRGIAGLFKAAKPVVAPKAAETA